MSNSKPVALVTGASSGIGRCVAIRLAKAGYRVALASRSEDRLREVAEEVGPDQCLVHPCDVGDADQAAKLVKAAVDHFGQLDVLVNNAGTAHLRSIAEHSLEQWRQTVDVNLTSVFATTQAAWPTFVAQEGGTIVNISSMSSKDPFPGLGVYGAAKVGVNMLTLVAAREGREHGIAAVCIAPGAVETPLLRSMFDASMVPESAALQPEELAELVHDCVTGKRDYNSGDTIFISR